MEIIRQVKLLEKELQTFVLGELGITPIWYREVAEIPGMIEEILKELQKAAWRTGYSRLYSQ